MLALLHLTRFRDGQGHSAVIRAWKHQDWNVLDRLHERGLIGDPRIKTKSVVLTEEGQELARELFQKLFGP